MSRRAWTLFAAMSVIWGVPYLMIKVAVDEVSVPVVVFARMAIGAVVLLPLAVHQFGTLRGHWTPIIGFAVIEMMLPWLLISDAEQHITSGMAGLLIAATPILAIVAGRVAGDRESLGVARIAGLAIGLAGVALLVAPELGGGSALAIVEMGVVAICYASAPLIVAKALHDVPTLPVTAACLAIGTFVYAPAAAMTWPAERPSAEALASLVGLGLVCTALAFVVFFALVHEAGPARALVFTYINPAVAVTAGVILLGEPLTLPIVTAFVLILAGCALATLRRRLPEDEAVMPA